MNIKEALAKLDPSDDAFWTGDGMPRMDVLQKMTLTPDLSRTQVTNAAPDFTRASVLEAETIDPAEDDNVEASPTSEQASEASEEVIEIPGGSDVMVEAEAPDIPEAPEIVTSAPEKPVSVPATKLEALQAALAIHTDAMNEADAASDQVNDLNRQIDAIMKADPHAATAGIRDYIKMQNKVRAERAGRARRFMGNSGANPSDVAKALEVRSPLDKAMHGRKPARGSQRPSIRG